MLETGNLGGKCADLNALFAGLCRSVGVPARDYYGLRVAPSAFGYRELGGNPSDLLLSDRALMLNTLLWMGALVVIIYGPVWGLRWAP